MTRVKFREWTEEEIKLICDISFGCKELGIMLNAREGTIRNKRKAYGIKSSQSSVMSKPRPNRYKREMKQCIAKDCHNMFEVKPASKKKYCSHSCQLKTNHQAPKGIGSRKMRNPLTPEYKRYSRKVHGLSQKTYIDNIDIINPNQYLRTLCGVENGWQLDHIIPIKECFIKGMSIEEAASVNNLRMLPWKDNLMRQYDNSN